MSIQRDIIGFGVRFTPGVDGRGQVALSGNEANVEESIEIIIGTAPGQRMMRPEFGCRIHDLIFAPINASTMATAQYYVREALARWEPRINVLDVIVEPDPDRPTCLLIFIYYRIKTTIDERALVYPFYTIPDEE